jgi:hypothetical protein
VVADDLGSGLLGPPNVQRMLALGLFLGMWVVNGRRVECGEKVKDSARCDGGQRRSGRCSAVGEELSAEGRQPF